MIDGASLGLPMLLTPASPAQCPPLALWRLPHQLRLDADATGEERVVNPSRTRSYGDDRTWPHATKDGDYLCYWRATETRPCAGRIGYHGGTVSEDFKSVLATLEQGTVPRLATATLLRDAPPRTVENFISYHLHCGFERVYLYFDDPQDSAIEVAEKLSRCEKVGAGVRVVRCSDRFWDAQRASNSFFLCNDSPNQVALFEAGDVQSRQMGACRCGRPHWSAALGALRACHA